MSKIDLTAVLSGFSSNTTMTANFEAIEDEFQNKVLYRDNPTGEPNTMQNDLDMNGYAVLNALATSGDEFSWRGNWVTSTLYNSGNIVHVTAGTYLGYSMIARTSFTSSAVDFDTDYLTGNWAILCQRGSGDLDSSNNLSDLDNVATARTNLSVPGLTTTNTFTQDQTVPDEAYDATNWNGSLEVPTKNAVRDEIESVKTDEAAKNKILHVRDLKSDGTSGGTSVAGSFLTRDLNTVVTNEITGASLSSNAITLPAGTYDIYATVPAFDCNSAQAVLYNTSDTSNEIIGTVVYSHPTSPSTIQSEIKGRFTLASEKP